MSSKIETEKPVSLPTAKNDSFETKHKVATTNPAPAKKQGIPIIATALIGVTSAVAGGTAVFLGAKQFNWFELGKKVQSVASKPLTESKNQSVNELKRLAEECNNAAAQFELGELYYYGSQGVPKNLATAMKWFTKAAKQGDAAAQYNLGLYYYYGKGVAKDLKTAAEWFKKAKNNGFSIPSSIEGELNI